MFLDYLTTQPVVSHKTMQNQDGEEFTITDETYGARIDDVFTGEYTRRTFSHSDDVFYIFSSDTYKLLVQKFDWGNAAQLSNLSKDKYLPHIFVDMDTGEDKKPEVTMSTISYSDDFTIEETEKFAERFMLVAHEMKWITKVVENVDELP